jgi:hypothetical protein
MAYDKHWLRPPPVGAPDPDDRAKTVTYDISEHLMYSLAGISRLSPIFQVWAHVVGELPPINNISSLARREITPTLTTLMDSVACFRGVKRPYDDEPEGHSVLVYVLNPRVTLDREPSLVCLAKAVIVPSDTCLTVQVKPVKALQPERTPIDTERVTPVSSDTAEDKIRGVVTRVEFVSGNGQTPVLPKRHDGRYNLKLWQTT